MQSISTLLKSLAITCKLLRVATVPTKALSLSVIVTTSPEAVLSLQLNTFALNLTLTATELFTSVSYPYSKSTPPNT